MIQRLGAALRDPVVLLALVAGLSAFVIQSGELGTSDTAHRLQAAHSWWTSEPEVLPQEYPEFGIHGRDGRLHNWYGIGQSLLMFPTDVIGTYLEELQIFDAYAGTDPSIRGIFVSYTTSILIEVLTVLVCLRFLRRFNFTARQSVAGVLALLYCTTHLHYTQNLMENNYILLLTLTGLCFQYEWVRTGSKRALWIGSGAFGLNLLTRLTTGLDLLAGGLFVFLLLWSEDKGSPWRRATAYAKIAVPTYAFFGLIDRVYQYYRFGSFFNTYMSVFAREYRQLNPSLPPSFPWNTPFREGFFGPLITPEKSIFLFDPLVILTVLLVVIGWKRFAGEIKAYLLAVSLLLLAYITFYARYFVWSGDFAWGDRYVSTTVELLAFISVPLLLRHRAVFGRFVWGAGISLVAISLVVQLASLAFWLPLEIYQMETLGHPTSVVALRLKNIIAFALGKMDAWGLNTPSMVEDPWDYVHITTWNFLPFLLRRIGEAPTWAVHVAFTVWGLAIAALAWSLSKLRKVVTLLPES